MFEIVADSGANLTAEQAAAWGVTVLPITKEAGEVAKMLKMLAEKKDVLCICMSDALSGTFRSIQMGTAGVRAKHRVVVVDSLSVCCGEGMLVELAVRERRKGASLEKALQTVQAAAVQICQLFLVGGVDNSAEPAVWMVDLQGKMVPCHKSKDRKTALRYMAKMYHRTALNSKNKIWIAHGNCFPDAAYLAGQIGTNTTFAEMDDSLMVHMGESTVALFYPGTLRTNPPI